MLMSIRNDLPLSQEVDYYFENDDAIQFIRDVGDRSLYPSPEEVISSFPFLSDPECIVRETITPMRDESVEKPEERPDYVADSKHTIGDVFTNSAQHIYASPSILHEEETSSDAQNENVHDAEIKDICIQSLKLLDDDQFQRDLTSHACSIQQPSQLDNSERSMHPKNLHQTSDPKTDSNIFLLHMNYLSLDRNQKNDLLPPNIPHLSHYHTAPESNNCAEYDSDSRIALHHESSAYEQYLSGNETFLRRAVSDTIHNERKLYWNESCNSTNNYKKEVEANGFVLDRQRYRRRAVSRKPISQVVSGDSFISGTNSPSLQCDSSEESSRHEVEVDSDETVYPQDEPQDGSLSSDNETSILTTTTKEIPSNPPLHVNLIKTDLPIGKDRSLKLQRDASEYADIQKLRRIKFSKASTKLEKDLSRRSHGVKKCGAIISGERVQSFRNGVSSDRMSRSERSLDSVRKKKLVCLGCGRTLRGSASASLIACPVCRVVTPAR